ncbi:hypothetical protein [Dyella sp.]|uniref:hypothetical protein n=1 Tax=Dyella sp. TaxID=1869338 RepID=UPI002ED36FAC
MKTFTAMIASILKPGGFIVAIHAPGNRGSFINFTKNSSHLSLLTPAQRHHLKNSDIRRFDKSLTALKLPDQRSWIR